MSSEKQRAYWRCYYRKNRKRIIASISENRRRRKRELRAHLTKLGLYPLPPEYFKAAQQRARAGGFKRRLLDLPDVYHEEDHNEAAEGEGLHGRADG